MGREELNKGEVKEKLGTGVLSKSLPEAKLTPEQREKLSKVTLAEMKEDMLRLAKHVRQLREYYPEEFGRLEKKHPDFFKYCGQTEEFWILLNADAPSMKDKDIVSLIDQYNGTASKINSVMRSFGNGVREDREKQITTAANGEMNFDEVKLTPEQQRELRQMAMDLWQELFPDSNVDKLAKFVNRQVTGDDKLLTGQKYLLAPANGIEGVIAGFINLMDFKTYQDVYASVKSISGMKYEDWCATWQSMQFLYERLPTEDKVAPVLSLICGLTFLLGGEAKIVQALQKLKYPKYLTTLVKGAVAARFVTRWGSLPSKILPLGAIGGISLKYVTL